MLNSTADIAGSLTPTGRLSMGGWTGLCFVAATAAVLRVSNLQGGRFSEPDEFRTLLLVVDTPVLSFLYRLPQLMFGSRHDVALFTTALLGTATVAMLFFVAFRLHRTAAGAFVSALVLACCALDIRYSRSGYPCIAQNLFLMVALGSALLGLRTPARAPFAIAGAASTAALCCYVPAYAPCAALFFLSAFTLFERRHNWRLIVDMLGTFLLSGIISGVLIMGIFALLVTGEFNPGAAIGELLRYQASTVTFIAPLTVSSTAVFLREWTGIDGAVAVAVALLLALWVVIVYRKSAHDEPRLIASFIAMSVMIFIGAGSMGLHTIYGRHFVFILPPLALLLGYLAAAERKSKWIIAMFCAAVVLQASSIRAVIESTFRIDGIRTDLVHRDIPLHQVASMIELHNPGDVERTLALPYVYTGANRTDPVIDWPSVQEQFQKGMIQYLITSGLGTRSTLGFADPILEAHTPIQRWEHPYHSLNRGTPKLQDFSLFALNSIFSERPR